MNVVLEVVPLLLLVLGAAAAVGYFLVAVPRRWRLPYEQARELLAGNDPEDLERAERLLAEAVNAGPQGAALAAIRLARACVRAKQGTYEPDRYAAAATVLEELIDTEGRTGDTAFLELWIQAQMENHERVVELHAEHAALLDGRPESRRLAAVSHFRLATDHWRRREADGAVRHFDLVRELGELTEHIPPEVDDLQLARGIQAVFDGQLDDARDNFTASRDRAAARGGQTVQAELGLVVCDWDADDAHRLGERLGALADRVEALPRASAQDAETAARLRSGIAVLRLVVLLREWLDHPALSWAPSPEDFVELARRADIARQADPSLGAPNLIEGLIRYYFALGQSDRDRALEVLERDEAAAKNVWPPEVLELIRRERELGGAGDAVSRYLSLLSEFLDDPSRSEQDLAQLRALKQRFARYAKPIDTDAAQPLQSSAADDHRHRAKSLRQRIEVIVKPAVRDLPEDAPARAILRDLLAELDQAADKASNRAAELQKAEFQLVTMAGQALLPEESGESDV